MIDGAVLIDEAIHRALVDAEGALEVRQEEFAHDAVKAAEWEPFPAEWTQVERVLAARHVDPELVCEERHHLVDLCKDAHASRVCRRLKAPCNSDASSLQLACLFVPYLLW